MLAPAVRRHRQARYRIPHGRRPILGFEANKSELQAQIEKLERTVATLRSSLTRAAKGNVARIGELKERMAQLDVATVIRLAPTAEKSKPAREARGKRKSRDVDRGDAVPPGVVVSKSSSLD